MESACYESYSITYDIIEALWEIRYVYRKYKIASTQVVLLNNYIRDMEEKIQDSSCTLLNSAQYCLGLRLSIVENLRKMFYIYAAHHADLLETLQIDFVELCGLSEWNNHLLTDPDARHYTAEITFEEN